MKLKQKFLFHGTPHTIDHKDGQTLAPSGNGQLFATDDINYARCYTVKNTTCTAILWGNDKYHVILTQEPEDMDHPGYIYQIPTKRMGFKKWCDSEFVTSKTYKVNGPNAIVHGIRELIEKHDVQVYIMPENSDPETFTKSLDCPFFIKFHDYLCNLGCRHLNSEWQHQAGAKAGTDLAL